MLTVTKQYRFCYSHQLPDYEGLCAKLHGHEALVEVEFKEIDGRKEYPTMVIDFSIIKKIVNPIIEKFDHSHLNDFIFYPTAESITEYIVSEIKKTDIGEGLIRVRFWETSTSYAEWKE